ncbi:hypothetical protein PIB19_02000 [Sphingomonas sp. 7/4-4]|uniref:hypothetical protein n=1 Tax=Sphingomonas sp. 7/4-4 TaxID=3018446 RepID=UPI0022F3C892|nr:hypothetical protein [Sphingomonas sp. 7/4-4]WBY08323.1 hypothetical protein PIB19_02000 [Sphingomonas sp. 7/4-4]
MGEFDDFTRKLSGDHQERTADHEVREAKERDDRHAGWDRDIALLETVATPLLDEAKRACEAQGMRPVIARNWERERFTDPAVEFQLFGPKKRPLDSSTYEVQANTTVVRVEDGKLRASITKRAIGSSVGVNYVGYDEDGIKQALKHSISSFYDEIDPGKA